MSPAGERMRQILEEAETLAVERFGLEKVDNIPLLVTAIAQGIATLTAASETSSTVVLGDMTN